MEHLFIYGSFFVFGIWGIALLLAIFDFILNLAGIRVKYNVEPVTKLYRYMVKSFKTADDRKVVVKLGKDMARTAAE
jgi:hypothetical protein